MSQYKVCNTCKQVKPVSVFYRRADNKDGLDNKCPACYSAYHKARYDANPEAARARSKRWRLENPEAVKEIKARGRDRHIQYNRQWYRENTERAAEAQRIYRASNRSKARSIVANRRARIKNNGYFAISDKEWERLYSSCCVYCGSKDEIQADHVIPVSRGGRHSIGNLVPACRICNVSKNDRTIMEWRLNKSSPRYKLMA